MLVTLFALIIGVVAVYSQQQTCTYTGGPHREYMLNLTAISDWTMEVQEFSGFNYYYTPCRNGMQCQQGNANYFANTAQYKAGINGCAFYLSVDHQTPPRYMFGAAAWHFHYEDGEVCQQTSEPRTTEIVYVCVEHDHDHGPPAHLVNVEEKEHCHYVYNVQSPLACIDEDKFNANCQWRVHGHNSHDTYMLDLSNLNGETIRIPNPNNYETYFSPCQNGLRCPQQRPHGSVMAMIENHATGTCDHYMALWEDGRSQPSYHTSATESYFQFHYFNGEVCQTGLNNVMVVNFICDLDVPSYKVINETSNVPCHWELNVATVYACNPTEEIVVDAKAWSGSSSSSSSSSEDVSF